jgi:hypothetical protein
MIAHVTSSVLIVDDDGEFRKLARRLLVASGLTVVGEAASIEEAVGAAAWRRVASGLGDPLLDRPDHPDGRRWRSRWWAVEAVGDLVFQIVGGGEDGGGHRRDGGRSSRACSDEDRSSQRGLLEAADGEVAAYGRQRQL